MASVLSSSIESTLSPVSSVDVTKIGSYVLPDRRLMEQTTVGFTVTTKINCDRPSCPTAGQDAFNTESEKLNNSVSSGSLESAIRSNASSANVSSLQTTSVVSLVVGQPKITIVPEDNAPSVSPTYEPTIQIKASAATRVTRSGWICVSLFVLAALTLTQF